jgi:pimeloyl-ACP methyl ester carboxylesterase
VRREAPRRSFGFMRTRVALGYIVLTLLSVSGSTAHASVVSCDGASVEKVSLVASDGIRTAGFVQGSGTLGVVLVHQVNRDHCGWQEEALHLAESSLVLSLDLRGYGASAKAKGSKALAYKNDIAAAVAELRKRGTTKVVLIGASMGGSAVVVAGAAITPPVDAVIAVSAPGNFKGQNALAAVRSLRVPFRAVAASDDGRAVSTAKSLAERASMSPSVEAITFASGGHGWALLRPGTDAQKSVDEFLTSLQ